MTLRTIEITVLHGNMGRSYFADLKMTFRQKIFLQDWFTETNLEYRVRVEVRVGVWNN
jgi:hypothetical protein